MMETTRPLESGEKVVDVLSGEHFKFGHEEGYYMVCYDVSGRAFWIPTFRVVPTNEA